MRAIRHDVVDDYRARNIFFAYRLCSMAIIVNSIVVGILLIATVVSSTQLRAKRQLSPAVRLEHELEPLVRLINIEQFKRDNVGNDDDDDRGVSSIVDSRRHLSPSIDVDDRLDKLIALQSVGKRQLSPTSDWIRQAELLHTIGRRSGSSLSPMHRYHLLVSQLADAGRKRSISPAVDLQTQLAALSRMVDEAGRR